MKSWREKIVANEVNLKIKVGDDGSLDIVAKKAEKAAKEQA